MIHKDVATSATEIVHAKVEPNWLNANWLFPCYVSLSFRQSWQCTLLRPLNHNHMTIPCNVMLWRGDWKYTNLWKGCDGRRSFRQPPNCIYWIWRSECIHVSAEMKAPLEHRKGPIFQELLVEDRGFNARLWLQVSRYSFLQLMLKSVIPVNQLLEWSSSPACFRRCIHVDVRNSQPMKTAVWMKAH